MLDDALREHHQFGLLIPNDLLKRILLTSSRRDAWIVVIENKVIDLELDIRHRPPLGGLRPQVKAMDYRYPLSSI